MISVRKVLHTEDIDDIAEMFDFDGTIDELKVLLRPAFDRPSRYTFYYYNTETSSWERILK